MSLKNHFSKEARFTRGAIKILQKREKSVNLTGQIKEKRGTTKRC